MILRIKNEKPNLLRVKEIERIKRNMEEKERVRKDREKEKEKARKKRLKNKFRKKNGSKLRAEIVFNNLRMSAKNNPRLEI